jgi:hypothetical protein
MKWGFTDVFIYLFNSLALVQILIISTWQGIRNSASQLLRPL